jgi:hypothetical protein
MRRLSLILALLTKLRRCVAGLRQTHRLQLDFGVDAEFHTRRFTAGRTSPPGLTRLHGLYVRCGGYSPALKGTKLNTAGILMSSLRAATPVTTNHFTRLGFQRFQTLVLALVTVQPCFQASRPMCASRAQPNLLLTTNACFMPRVFKSARAPFVVRADAVEMLLNRGRLRWRATSIVTGPNS